MQYINTYITCRYPETGEHHVFALPQQYHDFAGMCSSCWKCPSACKSWDRPPMSAASG